MKNRLLIILSAVIFLVSCTKGDNEPQLDKYLNKWLGNYQGRSHNWVTSPRGDMMVTTNTYADEFIEIKKSKKDSVLVFIYKDENNMVIVQSEYKIPPSGSYHSQWGAGSSYGTLSIQFDSTFLSYSSYQKCGIPCDSGTDYFLIKK